MKSGEYMLEIYEPNSSKDCWMSFTSSTPFHSIAVGDLINPGLWPGSESPMEILRVVNVEHAIWEHENKVKHKIMVFTQEVKVTEKTRLSR